MPSRSLFVRWRIIGSGPFREIAVVLVLKVILIFALSQLFFAPSRHVQPTTDEVSAHLFANSN